MPMIENEDRLKLRLEVRDFIIGAGSPVVGSQITNALGTNNHMVDRIINEFKSAGLIKPFYLGKNTNKPLLAWESTSKLEKLNKEELFKIIKIEKPRNENNN